MARPPAIPASLGGRVCETETLTLITRTARTPIMHRAVEFNGVVSFGGVIPEDLSGGMYAQTEQVTLKLDMLLQESGLDKTRLISATLFVTDMAQKDEMNRAWTAWLAPEHLPTRATIGVSDLGPGVLIEVVVTAGR